MLALSENVFEEKTVDQNIWQIRFFGSHSCSCLCFWYLVGTVNGMSTSRNGGGRDNFHIYTLWWWWKLVRVGNKFLKEKAQEDNLYFVVRLNVAICESNYSDPIFVEVSTCTLYLYIFVYGMGNMHVISKTKCYINVWWYLTWL